MSPSAYLFVGAVAISAGFAMFAVARDDGPGFAFFKPLTTLIVLLGAGWLIQPGSQPYRGLVALGLALSLAGDVLLLPRLDRFTAGLAAFLLAYLAYLGAFTVGNPVVPGQLLPLAPFLVAGAAVVRYLWSDLGRRRVPVLVYLTVVCAMGWRAATRGHAPGVTRASFVLALAGACLLLASDAIVAVRRFRHPSRAAHIVEPGLYWAAQLSIALSIRS